MSHRTLTGDSVHVRLQYISIYTNKNTHSPFSAPEKMEIILLRGFLSSGTEGKGLEL